MGRPSGTDYIYDPKSRSLSPAPSPRGSGYFDNNQTPVRPPTRARGYVPIIYGYDNNDFSPPRDPSFSPRYIIDVEYGTASVSQSKLGKEWRSF